MLEFPLRWCDDPPKYLGVIIHRTASKVVRLNYGPAIDSLSGQIDRWNTLPLSIVGRIVIIKMVVLPRFLYLFLNIPIPLTANVFKTLSGLLIWLIWWGAGTGGLENSHSTLREGGV